MGEPIIHSNYSFMDEDKEAAKELGISIYKYLAWKKGFRETYVNANVLPVEGYTKVKPINGVYPALRAKPLNARRLAKMRY